MINESNRNRLLERDVFRFVKALRNITMHHSVLAAPQPGAKFERPFSRYIPEIIGGASEGSAELAMRYEILRDIFDSIVIERPREKKTIDAARCYLSKLERQVQPIFLESVLLEALAVVKTFVF